MKKFLKDETGEFAIDAIFGITFFMITLIAVMFMSLIIRVQSNIQYALGQTAKEISGYYYLVDKLGLAAATSGSGNKSTDIDETIKTIVDFSSSAENTISSVQNIDLSMDDINALKRIQENVVDVTDYVNQSVDCFKRMESQISSLNGDSVTQVLSVFAKTATNRVASTLIAPFICKKLMPKYLSSQNSGNIDDYFKAIGIKPESVNFKGSQFLTDKRSIKIQIIYQLDLEKYTLGFVKTPLYFKQTASTAAWVRPDDTNLLTLKDLGY